MTNQQMGERYFNHQEDNLIGGDYQLLEEETQISQLESRFVQKNW